MAKGPEYAAIFIAAMTKELGTVAQANQLVMLSVLLQMAEMEARDIAISGTARAQKAA